MSSRSPASLLRIAAKVSASPGTTGDDVSTCLPLEISSSRSLSYARWFGPALWRAAPRLSLLSQRRGIHNKSNVSPLLNVSNLTVSCGWMEEKDLRDQAEEFPSPLVASVPSCSSLSPLL